MNENDEKLSKEEQNLANQLRKICYKNGKEKSPSQSAKFLHKLGLVYQQRSPDKVSLIKSCALLNAAMIRNPDNVDEIKQDLQKFCCHVLSVAKANNKKADLVSQSLLIAKEIKLMREQAEDALNKVEKIPDNVEKEDLTHLEQIKISTMQRIQLQVTQSYKNVMKNVSDFCEKVMGKPPCKYALVGMGSMARDEITPYSDFENIIVLEDGCKYVSNYEEILEYFRWFAVIFQIILINLGETILPSVCIQSLNDYTKKGGDWFFDISPRGISFDGMMPHACKSPLGRQQMTDEKPWKTELIKPVSLMLNYLKTEESLKNGYHLRDILTKTCFVSGNSSIYEQFSSGAQTNVAEVDLETRKLHIREQIQDDLSSYGTKQSLADNSTFRTKYKQNDLSSFLSFNVKRIVYRSTTLFVSALASLHDINASSCFDIITELRDKQVINNFDKHKLMYGIALACEIRLRVYMEKKSQDDWVHHKSNDSNLIHKLAELAGENAIFSYFRIAYALQFITCNQLGINKSNFYSHSALLNISISYFLGNYDKVQKYISQFWNNQNLLIVDCCNFAELMKQLETPITLDITSDLLSISSGCFDFKFSYDNYKLSEALLVIGNYLYQMHKPLEAQVFINIFLQSIEHLPNSKFLNQQKAEALIKVASCEKNSEKQLQYCKDSLKLFEQINHMHGQAVCLNLIGNCLMNLFEYPEALQYFKKSLEFMQELPLLISTTFNDIGICLTNMSQYNEAMSWFNKAMNIYQKLSFDETADKNIAWTLKSIGSCLIKISQYTEAMKHFKKALKIQQKLSKDKTRDLYVAVTLNDIGICLEKTFQYSEAQNCLKEALQIQQKVSDNPTKDTNIASTLSNIGNCSIEMSQYTDAMEYYNKALRIYRKISVDDTKNRNVASLLNNIGICLKNTSEYAKGIDCLNKALSIYKETLSNETLLDRDFASTLQSISRCYLKTFQYTKAMECLNKALEILHKTTSDKTKDVDVAMALSNMGRCSMKVFQYKQAMNYFDDALKIFQKLSVDETTDKHIASTSYCIGVYLIKTFQYTEAMTYLNQALLIAQKASDKETGNQSVDDDVAITHNNIGICSMKLFEFSKAMKAFEKALTFFRKISVDENADTNVASVLYNIGICSMDMFQYTKSMEYLRKALEVFHKSSINVSKDVNLAKCYQEYGRYLMKVFKYNDSINYLEKSLAIFQNVSSDDKLRRPFSDRDVASTLQIMGTCLTAMDNFTEGYRCYDDALKIFRNVTTDENKDQDIGSTFRLLGLHFLKLSEYDESMDYLKKSLKIHQKSSIDESKDRNVANTLQSIGDCLNEMNEHKESMDHLNRALKIYQTTSVDEKNDEDLARTLRSIGHCLMRKCKYTESLEYFNKALLIFQKISVYDDIDENVCRTIGDIQICRNLC